MVNKKRLILHKTGYVYGKKHDYDLYKNTHPSTPPAIELYMDLGYEGVEDTYS